MISIAIRRKGIIMFVHCWLSAVARAKMEFERIHTVKYRGQHSA